MLLGPVPFSPFLLPFLTIHGECTLICVILFSWLFELAIWNYSSEVVIHSCKLQGSLGCYYRNIYTSRVLLLSVCVLSLSMECSLPNSYVQLKTDLGCSVAQGKGSSHLLVLCTMSALVSNPAVMFVCRLYAIHFQMLA